jgi:hypothetical protein
MWVHQVTLAKFQKDVFEDLKKDKSHRTMDSGKK